MTTRKKTTFNPDWVNPATNNDWANIFKAVSGDPFSAYCKLCSKSFSLSNMGRASLVSHEKSVGHKKRSTAKKITPSTDVYTRMISNVSEQNAGPSTEQNAQLSVSEVVISPQKRVQSTPSNVNFFVAEKVVEAEILWALHSVETHLSLNSVNKTLPVLQLMFKGCQTAEKMKLSSKKLSYLITHGLAPYFQEQLEDTVKKCSFFVVSFDESLNRISQRGQMDLIVRFWDGNRNLVQTR